MNLVQTRMLAHSNHKEVRRFAKFATVGAAGAVTHVTLLNLLVQLAHLPSVAANPIGFCAAVLQNFILNRRWTYPESRERHAGSQLLQFAIVSLVGLVLNQLIFLTVLRRTEPLFIKWAGQQHLGHLLGYNFAWAVAVGIVMVWNFGVNRLWTYRGI
ncbi:MAG: GtrA family protein [Caldilineaceae bacterium]